MSDLKNFIASVSGDDHLSVEENLGNGFVRLRTAEAQRRQAKHDIRCVEDLIVEMLRNARDAHARNIYVSILRDGDMKFITFVDDGDGIPTNLHEAIFEPRVTSKLETMVMDKWGVHGRGMALYSIKMNSEDAHVASSFVQGGSSFSVKVDLNKLPEKKDQSTYPNLIREEDGTLTVGNGPHNVIRTVVEFALEHKDTVTVYLGSPTEILATLIKNGRKALTDNQLLFCDDIDSLPVCVRCAAASDASELQKVSKSLALPISERTAHRILAGQIDSLTPPLKKISPHNSKHKSNIVDIYKDNRGLKISKEDLDLFARKLEDSFDSIASRYYIQLSDAPKIRVGKDSITVKFSVEKEL